MEYVTNFSDVNSSNISMALSSGVTNSSRQLSYICFILMGIIIPLGLVCNSLSFVVFVTSKVLRRTSTGNYLMALCIADWLYLAGDLIRWMHTTSQGSEFYLDVNFMFTNYIVCKTVHYVRYFSKLASAWITVAITTERFISVRWPLHAHTLSTRWRAQVVILLTYVVCFGLGAYPLWTVSVVPWKSTGVLACMILDRKEYDIWSWVVLRVGSLALPGVLMSVLTALIIYNLTKAKNTRQKRLSCNADGRGKAPQNNKIERQLTIILLAVAVSFVILRLPYTVVYYINEYKRQIWPDDQDMINLMFYLKNITNVIASTNYVINFFLYCVCGSSFRRQLQALTSCGEICQHHKATKPESKTFLTKVSNTPTPSKTSSVRP